MFLLLLLQCEKQQVSIHIKKNVNIGVKKNLLLEGPED